MKNKIDPRHAELFEEMFGANAKGENVEIPTEYQKRIEKYHYRFRINWSLFLSYS